MCKSVRWRAVIGWEGWYEVSDQGRVRRVCGGDRNTVAGRILKTQDTGKGYRSVCLCRDGKPRRLLVHVLVAEAFLGPKPSPKHEVNHEDGRKHRNRADNLEWKTRKGNMEHAVATGLMHRGERSPHAKLTDDSVREVRRRCASGEFQRVVGDDFGVTQATIHAIVHRKSWRHVTP
jgi:hypothetical protein